MMFVMWILPCLPHCMPVLSKEVLPGINVMTLSMGVLAAPVQFCCAYRFHIGAYHSFKSGVWDMNVLISLGTGLTFFYSFGVVMFAAVNATILANHHHCKAPPTSYFEAPCMIITFILLGKSLEAWARRKTSKSLRDLLALKPAVAYLIQPARCNAPSAANLEVVHAQGQSKVST